MTPPGIDVCLLFPDKPWRKRAAVLNRRSDTTDLHTSGRFFQKNLNVLLPVYQFYPLHVNSRLIGCYMLVFFSYKAFFHTKLPADQLAVCLLPKPLRIVPLAIMHHLVALFFWLTYKLNWETNVPSLSSGQLTPAVARVHLSPIEPYFDSDFPASGW